MPTHQSLWVPGQVSHVICGCLSNCKINFQFLSPACEQDNMKHETQNTKNKTITRNLKSEIKNVSNK